MPRVKRVTPIRQVRAPHRFSDRARQARDSAGALEDTDAPAERWIAEARRLAETEHVRVELEEGRIGARELFEDLERGENPLREGPIARPIGGVAETAARRRPAERPRETGTWRRGSGARSPKAAEGRTQTARTRT